MKRNYLSAIIIPTLTISISIFTLLATLLIYWNFQNDLRESINYTLQEDESILLTVINQPQILIKDLYKSYTLKRMSYSYFDEKNRQLHPKSPVNKEIYKLLQLNPDDKRFYILSKKDTRHIISIVTRLEVNKQSRTIISQKDLSYLYSNLLEDIIVGILLLIVGSLILSFLLYRVSLKLLTPLKDLVRNAEYISSGHYQERVPLINFKEIDEVGSAFNKMAIEIEKKIDTLEIENEKKELFISGFTHELKTPLTNIIGYTDHIRRMNPPEKERMNALDVIYREGKRLNTLGVYLRDFILLDNTEIELLPLSLEQISRDIKDISAGLLKNKNLTLKIEYNEGIININRELYLTCCMNIIHNAVKASELESSIEIKLDVVKNMFQSVFIDHGIGIPLEELSKITKPFHQGLSVLKKQDKNSRGFGLGLFLVDRIIRKGFKGSIEIDSVEEEYTEVRVIIPC